jgi:hypothetical protein
LPENARTLLTMPNGIAQLEPPRFISILSCFSPKAATHWWLRNHRDLIPNTFALKTIFGWVTDKELNRYTRDFDREAEADGMLIKLSERRKTS